MTERDLPTPKIDYDTLFNRLPQGAPPQTVTLENGVELFLARYSSYLEVSRPKGTNPTNDRGNGILSMNAEVTDITGLSQISRPPIQGYPLEEKFMEATLMTADRDHYPAYAPYFFAGDFLRYAVHEFDRQGGPVTHFLAHWTKGTNHEAYTRARQAGARIDEAVNSTWTAKILAQVGFIYMEGSLTDEQQRSLVYHPIFIRPLQYLKSHSLDNGLL